MPAARKSYNKKKTAKSANNIKSNVKSGMKSLARRNPMLMSPYMKMLNDPWSEVKNVQLMDSYQGSTVGLLLKYSRTIQTDAAGAFATEITSNPQAYWRDAASITADVPSYSNDVSLVNAHPQWASFQSSTRAFRPLGNFVRLNYISNADDLSGVFSGIITTSGTGTAISSWGDDQHSQSATNPVAQGTFHASAHLIDRPSFLEATTSIVPPHRYQMPHITIGGSGLPPSTACVRLETLLYLELEPQANSILTHASRKTPVGTFVPTKQSHTLNPKRNARGYDYDLRPRNRK